MSAQAEIRLYEALMDAIEARQSLEGARELERRQTWRYMHEARRQHVSWRNIGAALGISDIAAKKYYERNHGKVIST